MSIQEWRTAFAFTCIALVFLAWVPVIPLFLTPREETFLVLAILGEQGTTEHYYPRDDPRIRINEDVHWTLYLQNSMGSLEYVALRVKLLNSSMVEPSSTLCIPSPEPAAYELRRVLMDNETWLLPFNWSIKRISRVGEFLEIRLVAINGQAIETRVSARGGENFRLIIELWIYDMKLGDFRFGWNYGGSMRCVWNQMWFNSTGTAS